MASTTFDVVFVPDGRASNPRLGRRWRFERLLTWARWGAAAIWLILAAVVPSESPTLMVAGALAFGIGNIYIWWVLRGEPDWRRLQVVQRVATGLAWAGAIVLVGLATGRLAMLAPTVFVIPVLTAGIRYRASGALVAVVVASLLTVAAFGWHAGVRDAIEPGVAVWAAVAQIVQLKLVGFIVCILARESDALRHEITERHGVELAVCHHSLTDLEVTLSDLRREVARQQATLDDYRRQQFEISRSEWTVLKLLLAGYTYNQIANQQTISRETVRSHVRNLGSKLDAPGGRKAIEARAHELGIPSTDESDTPI